MKATFRIFAAAAIAALGILTSCQKQEPDIPGAGVPAGKELVHVTLIASITETKVSYNETGADLQPYWEDGDTVIGFDDENNSYEFIVSTISADGKAKLIGEAPADCNLHLIYLGSATPSDTEGLILPISVNYEGQAGDKNLPAVMLADGEVKKGMGKFHFRNAGAIIGISAVKGIPQGSNVTKVTVSGANLSAASIALNGSALALTATTKTNDAISVYGLDLTVTDANGTLSSPVFLAVPAGAKIAKVSASVPKEPETMTIPSTSADKKDIDYVEIKAKYDGTTETTKKWAKWNVGANSQSDYGWYFNWGGTNGYVFKNSKWVSASGIETYSYFPSSAYTVIACDYVYVKTQTFTGHRFDWALTPYQTQGQTEDDNTKFTKYLGSTSSPYKNPSATDEDALKTVLAPEDDAAHVNWGGSWRIPTSAELQALKDATYWAWDATDMGYYVFSPDTSHTAGTRVDSIPGDLSKTNAILFFPAAGYGNYYSFYVGGSYGFYWSSTLDSSEPNGAYYLRFYYYFAIPQSIHKRYNACPVRPLSD